MQSANARYLTVAKGTEPVLATNSVLTEHCRIVLTESCRTVCKYLCRQQGYPEWR